MKIAKYILEDLGEVQGWIYRTDGLFVVRRDCEGEFKEFIEAAGFTPTKHKFKTALGFLDAIDKKLV